MMSQKRYHYQYFKANLCYMLKEFSILLKIYTGYLIVPPSFDTVHHFLSQITNFVLLYVVLRYIYCCFVLHVEHSLHVDINRGVT
jgi:hypothetical protein